MMPLAEHVHDKIDWKTNEEGCKFFALLLEQSGSASLAEPFTAAHKSSSHEAVGVLLQSKFFSWTFIAEEFQNIPPKGGKHAKVAQGPAT
eukprot:1156752-Pelagomonas_calceolata.AAC.5